MDEDRENTSDNYFNLGITQHILRDYTSFTELHKRALNIRQKALCDDHENTADRYFNLGVSQCILKEATESHERALKIKQKVMGEDHENAAENNFNPGVTQYMLRDYTSATESHKRAEKRYWVKITRRPLTTWGLPKLNLEIAHQPVILTSE